MTAKFKIFKSDVTGQYKWALVAPNGTLIAKSPVGYSSKLKVENAIELVKKYAERAEIEK